MKTEQIMHMVSVQCKPENEAKFNHWMDEVHIPLLLKFQGLISATRYKSLYPSNEYARYMTQYIFESKEAFKAYEASPELAAAIEEMAQSWKQGELEQKWRVQYQLMSNFRQ